MPNDNPKKAAYLGDGVYVCLEPEGIGLTLNAHTEPTLIYMSSAEIIALVRYCEEHNILPRRAS